MCNSYFIKKKGIYVAVSVFCEVNDGGKMN